MRISSSAFSLRSVRLCLSLSGHVQTKSVEGRKTGIYLDLFIRDQLLRSRDKQVYEFPCSSLHI